MGEQDIFHYQEPANAHEIPNCCTHTVALCNTYTCTICRADFGTISSADTVTHICTDAGAIRFSDSTADVSTHDS